MKADPMFVRGVRLRPSLPASIKANSLSIASSASARTVNSARKSWPRTRWFYVFTEIKNCCFSLTPYKKFLKYERYIEVPALKELEGYPLPYMASLVRRVCTVYDSPPYSGYDGHLPFFILSDSERYTCNRSNLAAHAVAVFSPDIHPSFGPSALGPLNHSFPWNMKSASPG